jgi:uncharacterized membrane-anchored protein
MKAVATRTIAAVGALIVLVAVNGSIVAKERIKTHGERIYLELLPVDPRSLMQGDYMALRFALAERIPTTGSGSAPLLIDERGVATLDPDSHAEGLRIRYRVRNERVWLGTNAYFFEEGTAQHFTRARYGEFRVDRTSGEAVLVALRGPELEELRGDSVDP